MRKQICPRKSSKYKLLARIHCKNGSQAYSAFIYLFYFLLHFILYLMKDYGRVLKQWIIIKIKHPHPILRNQNQYASGC